MDDELKRLGINKKDLEKKSSSGMGERHPVEGLHLKKAQVPKGITKKPKIPKKLKKYTGQGPDNVTT